MATNDTISALAEPQAVEAEEALLGSVLIDPESYFEVSGMLREQDFFVVKHGWVWSAFASLHERNFPIDLRSTADELDRTNRLEGIGGPAFLTRLVTLVPSALHVAAYGKTVEEAAIRRRLLRAASDIAKAAYDKSTDIAEVVSHSEQLVFAVSEARMATDLQPIRQVAADYYERVQYLYEHQDQFTGVRSGFHDLDLLLGGMQNSDLIVIAGRPGRGKSAFMISVALNAAVRDKKQVAIFSLEMSNEQVMQRMVAQQTKIDAQRLRLGKLTADEMTKFAHSTTSLAALGMHLDDTPSISTTQLRAKCRRLDAETRLDLVIVDYLQLMTAEVGRENNRVQEVSAISRSLKALARELRVPVLAGAQLSRGVEQRKGQRPMLADLRESGSIEQDSDVVMFLHHPDEWDEMPEKKEVTELVVAKHRNGRTGTLDLIFLPQFTQFADAVHKSISLD